MADANRKLLAQLNVVERLASLPETKRISARRARLKMERLKAQLRRVEQLTRRTILD